MKIEKYKVNVLYANGVTYCDVFIIFEKKIKSIYFNLSEGVELLIDSYFTRKSEFIKIYFEKCINSISMKVSFQATDNSFINFNHFVYLPSFGNDYSIKSIDITSRDYLVGGNYKDGNLFNLVLAYSKNKPYIQIKNNSIEECLLPNCVDMPEVSMFYKCEIEKFLVYYDLLFNTKISCNIIFSKILISNAISCKDLIVIDESIFKRGMKTCLYLYLFHELIHQVLGNTILFIGIDGMIVCECLTEYASYYYLKERFNEKVFINQISKHAKICLEIEKQAQNMKNGLIYEDDYKFSKGISLLYHAFRCENNEKELFLRFILKVIACSGCSKDKIINILKEVIT